MILDPDVLTFDSFTTLVDVGTSTRRILDEHVDDPESIADCWRTRAVDYRLVSACTGEYESYERTTRHALEYALASHDTELPSAVVDEITSVFFELDVYPDVAGGMAELSAAGYDLYILSNGTPRLLHAMVDRAGIGPDVEGIISTHGLETYKPAPRVYTHAADRIGVSASDVAHVAAPWYDIYGAMHAGMGAIWMNRDGKPWDRFDGEPDLVVSGFDELLEQFVT